MSWSSAAPRASRRALAALLLLPLAGCGFHPLYSQREEAIDEPALASIKISPIKDRIGQMLEFELRESLNPRGIHVETRYRLVVALQVIRTDLGIERDAASSRARVDVIASFVLADANNGAPVYRGTTATTSAFNITDDAYAAQVAEDDARARTVRDLTDEIRTRLSLFLRRERLAG